MMSVETESKMSLKYHMSFSVPFPKLNFYQLLNLFPDPDSEKYFMSYVSKAKLRCHNEMVLVRIDWTKKEIAPIAPFCSLHNNDISCVKNLPGKNIYFLADQKGYVSKCQLIREQIPYLKSKSELIRASPSTIYLLEVSESSQILIIFDEKAQIILMNIEKFQVIFKREMDCLSVHPFFLEVLIFTSIETGESRYPLWNYLVIVCLLTRGRETGA